MDQQKEFKYSFQDLSIDGMLSIETNATGNQKIKINLEKNEKIWISANKNGWLHLARICAELGMGNYEPGYHFHKSFDFQDSEEKNKEINFEVGE
ncbi:MAG: hypothetical protein ABIK26_01660 [Candidatus Omnitrophota bacterium]|nr:hypothetical protein [Candidatus Omnitrophota bacterium]MBU1524008.1 hypothetical protein [Candidatus Omnitrophota bacterium]